MSSQPSPASPTSTPPAALPNGIAAAALLAAGIGSFTLGLLTTLAVISAWVSNALNWWDPVGPLSAKTGLAYIVWLISWVIAHQALKARQVNFGKLYAIALVLIALGLLGTFPTFFEAFAH